MFNDLINNVMKLGIITANDVERLTAVELMLLIIERCNGLLEYLQSYIAQDTQALIDLDNKYKVITDEIKDKMIDNETYFNQLITENLEDIALEKMNAWLSDGTLESLINQTALANISNRVTTLEKWRSTYIDEGNQSVVVMKRNVDFNSAYFRIPFMTVTNNGTIIAGGDVRYNSGADHSFIDLGYKRSTDGGKTWSEPKIAIHNKRVNDTYSRVMDGTILCDTHDNKIYLLGNSWESDTQNWTQTTDSKHADWDVLLAVSEDDGETFSQPISLRHLGGDNISQWIGGVGTGICMSNGTLVFPIQVSFTDKVNSGSYQTKSGIIYSTNHGTTWQMSTSFVDAPSSECTIVEIDGGIILNARSDGNKNRRLYKTTNLGTSWTSMRELSENTEQYNACQGHMIKLPYKHDREAEMVLFSHPKGTGRNALCVDVLNASRNQFNGIGTVFPWGYDGYSCLAYDSNRNELYVLYEGGDLIFENITYMLKNCNRAFSEVRPLPKYKANQPLIDIKNRPTFYIGGNKYGSNDNDGLTWDKALKDFTRLPELTKDIYACQIYVHNEYDGKLQIANLQCECEITGKDNYNIPTRGLYIRNCPLMKITRGLDVIEAFSSDYTLAFEGANVGISMININPSLTNTYLIYSDNSKISARLVKFNDELLQNSQTRAEQRNTIVKFFPRHSNINLKFDYSEMIPFQNICSQATENGDSNNVLTINDLPTNASTVSHAYIGNVGMNNLSITGANCPLTGLHEGLTVSSSGAPSVFMRNSIVFIEGDIIINNFSQVTRNDVIAYLPLLYRPTTSRRVNGCLMRVNLGVIEESVSVILTISDDGEIKFVSRPESNNFNALEIFGSYSIN